MVEWIIGIIWGGFMLAGMLITLVLVGEQIKKWFKNK